MPDMSVLSHGVESLWQQLVGIFGEVSNHLIGSYSSRLVASPRRTRQRRLSAPAMPPGLLVESMIRESPFAPYRRRSIPGSIDPMSTNHDLIVVGTSAGGVDALKVLAGGLPESLPAAVLIVMHTSPEGPYLLPDILGRVSPLRVSKVNDGDLIEPGRLYIAPPGHHLLVKGDRINLSRGPKENRSRPAIDPLFRTAAAAYGSRVVGVILTGMLDDGTAGLSAVKERGGITVVQDPEDSLYPSMPTSAIRHVSRDFVLPISEIASRLTRLTREPASRSEAEPLPHLMEIESRFAEMETMSMKDMDGFRWPWRGASTSTS